MRLLSELVGRDMGSVTGKNLTMMERETGLNPWSTSSSEIGRHLFANKTPIPEQDAWRLEYLGKLLHERYTLSNQMIDTKHVSSLIDAICIN